MRRSAALPAGRRITRAAALLLLALLIPDSVEAATIQRYEPTVSQPNGSVVIHGRGFGRSPNGRVIKLGREGSTSPSVTAPAPSDADWSPDRIQVRLPPGLAAGRYWLAIYRGSDRQTSGEPILTVHVIRTGGVRVPVTAGIAAPGTLSSARVQSGWPCAGAAVLYLQGGPFQAGTGGRVSGYGHRDRGGATTWVEVRSAGDDDRFWNSMVFEVAVESPSTLRVEIGKCFLRERDRQIRVRFPNGSNSAWVTIPPQETGVRERPPSPRRSSPPPVRP